MSARRKPLPDASWMTHADYLYCRALRAVEIAYAKPGQLDEPRPEGCWFAIDFCQAYEELQLGRRP